METLADRVSVILRFIALLLMWRSFVLDFNTFVVVLTIALIFC